MMIPENRTDEEETVVPTATDLIVEADEESGGGREVLPGDEVSVIRDRDATGIATDNRGIVERIVDAVTHDDNRHIDRRSGPSI